MSTYDALAGILTKRFKVPQPDIVSNTAMEDLGMDSLFLVEFLVVVEQDFGIRIDDEKVSPSNSLDQLAELVDQQLAEGNRSS